MADYHKYQLEDFLADRQFVNWVLSPESCSDLFWKSWLKNHPEKEALINEARFIIQHVQFRKADEDAEQMETVLQKILNRQQSPKSKSAGYLSSPQWAMIAASVLFLIVAGLTLKLNNSNPEATTTSIPILEKINQAGQKSIITLSDGSRIKLNANSSLSYPAQFKDSARIIHLTGEAFFEVYHDPAHPFVVYVNDVKIIALGTSFNVKAFSDDDEIAVALSSGKVQVNDNQLETSILTPGQKLKYNKNTRATVISSFNSEEELAWKDNIIYFKKADFNAFVKEIERWYGVSVDITGTPDSEWRITGKFEDISLELLMESVKFSKEINYQIEGNIIKISF